MQQTWRTVSVILALAVFVAYMPCPAAAQIVPVGAGERVYVLGAVNSAGDFEFKPGMGAKEALELAGGLAPNADPKGGVLLRANGEKINLDLTAILDGKEKISLEAGDTVIVKPGVVHVEGQVRKPGAYDLRAGMTAAEVVSLAGGLTEKAAPTAAYVTRNAKTAAADLSDPESKLVLQSGDVLTVPELSASITGEVERPGTYTLVAGKTDNLEGLFEQAGGPTAKADLKRVRVTSVQGTERPTKVVDASDKLARERIRVAPGDAVFVPQAEVRRGHRVTLSEVYQVTLILYTLIQIFHH